MKSNSASLIYLLLFISTPIFADLISVTKNPAEIKYLPESDWFSNGQSAKIIDPPASTINFYADVEATVGFNEKQNITLPAPLEVDNGYIRAGTVVSSHIIFLTKAEEDNTILGHDAVQWEFDSTILGVMSDIEGSLLFQSSPLLGAEGTVYHPPDTSIMLYGMEGWWEYYTINNNILTTNLRTKWEGPGDWIRVITLVDDNAVPEPATLLLILFCLPLIILKKTIK